MTALAGRLYARQAFPAAAASSARARAASSRARRRASSGAGAAVDGADDLGVVETLHMRSVLDRGTERSVLY
jgi:hypothetical protein